MSRAGRSPGRDGPAGETDDARVEAVLRILGGENRIGVAGDLGVGLEILEEWERVFLRAGRDGLARARAPMNDAERMRTWAKIGELTMRLDLLCRFIARKGYADELEALDKRTTSYQTGRTQ